MFSLPTILLALACITFLTTALLVVAATYSERSPELRLWAIGNVIVSVGLVLNGPNSTVVPPLLGIVCGTGLLALGQLIILAGMRAYLGKPTPWGWVAVLTLIPMAVSSYYFYVDNSLYARVLSMSFLFAAINLLSAWVLQVPALMPVKVAIRLTQMGFLVMGAALLLRGVYLWLHPSVVMDESLQKLIFLTILMAMMAQIAIAFGAILMVTYRYAAEMKRLSLHDALTGALNRAGMTTHAKAALQRTMRIQEHISVLMIDVDHFKAINDRYGHPMGDHVLRHLVDVIHAHIRPHDRLARYGGEEFLVLLDTAGPTEAVAAAERLRKAIAGAPAVLDNTQVNFTVSIGAASTHSLGYDFDALLAKADAALYRAKQAGRDRVCLAESG